MESEGGAELCSSIFLCICSASSSSCLESTFMPGTIFLSGAMKPEAAPGSGILWFAGWTSAMTSMPNEGAEYIMTPVIPLIMPPVISGTPDFLASFSEFSPE